MPENNIRSVIEQFLHTNTERASRELREFRVKLFDQFQKFLNQNYQLLEPHREYSDYCLESKPTLIPYLFNLFHNAKVKEGMSKVRIIEEIGKFATWLYEKNYTPNLAIEYDGDDEEG